MKNEELRLNNKKVQMMTKYNRVKIEQYFLRKVTKYHKGENVKKIGKIFAGIFAILFCGGLPILFSHEIFLLNNPKTAEILAESHPIGKSFLEEGEACKFLDYGQYFVDHEMLNDIATTTVTGSGVAGDPYIINSSEDFWWMTKYKMYWNGPTNLFVELGCDIVLNEEEFDKDGKVVQGTSLDGRVYGWKAQNVGGDMLGNSTMTFDGKGHTISGLYLDSPTGTHYIAMFQGAKEIRNLNCKNFYVNVNTGAGIVNRCNKLENCHMLSGFLNARGSTNWGSVAGLIFEGGYVKNCTNRATITSMQGSNNGIVCSGAIEVRDCINYGTMYAAGSYACGIGEAKYYYNCINYGDIKQFEGKTLHYSGGICGVINNSRTFVNCANYGKISGHQGIGGFIGWLRNNADVTIANCHFGGSASVTYSGANIAVAVCDSMAKVLMKNCTMEVNDYTSATGVEYSKSIICFNDNTIIENMKIKVQAKSKSTEGGLLLSNNVSAKQMRNVYVETDFDLQSATNLFLNKKKPKILDGLIVKTPSQKFYYGSDFSGFNISWRTGEISQKWDSEKGCFQGRVDLETLDNLNFDKIVLNF